MENLRFSQINKASVLNDAKEFNKPQINTFECRRIITKLLYMIHNKEKLTVSEATQLFFSVTKLFRSNNVNFGYRWRIFYFSLTSCLFRIGELEKHDLYSHKRACRDRSRCYNSHLQSYEGHKSPAG